MARRPRRGATYHNRRILDYAGQPAGVTLGAGWERLVHPDDVPVTRATWLHSVGTGEPFETEYRLRRHDGAYRRFLARAHTQLDGRGDVVRWVGTCTDIEDQKGAESRFRAIIEKSFDAVDLVAAEEAMRESERRYRELFEANPHPMWVYDTETLRFLAVNEAAIQRYGYARDEFLAMTVADIRPPEDVPALHADVLEPARRLQTRGVWRHRWKDGTLRDVEVAAHSQTFVGRPARLVLALDVTDRLRAEGELRRTSEPPKAVVDGTTDAVFVKDRDGKYLLANPATAQFVGRADGDVLGRTDAELFDPESARRVAERDRQVMTAGAAETDVEVLTAAGVTRTYLATKAPYFRRDLVG